MSIWLAMNTTMIDPKNPYVAFSIAAWIISCFGVSLYSFFIFFKLIALIVFLCFYSSLFWFKSLSYLTASFHLSKPFILPVFLSYTQYSLSEFSLIFVFFFL